MSLEAGFEVSDAQEREVSLFLPVSYGSRCRTLKFFASTMSACSHVSHYDDNGLNLNYKPASVKYFPL